MIPECGNYWGGGEMYSPPREEGWLRESQRAHAQTGWSGMGRVSSCLTTPALRATPPVSGGDFRWQIFF